MKEFIIDLLTKVNNAINKKFYNLAKRQSYIYFSFEHLTSNGSNYEKPSDVQGDINYYLGTLHSTNKTITLKKGVYLFSSTITIIPQSSNLTMTGLARIRTEELSPVTLQEIPYYTGPAVTNGSAEFHKTDIIVIDDENQTMGFYANRLEDQIPIYFGCTITPLCLK